MLSSQVQIILHYSPKYNIAEWQEGHLDCEPHAPAKSSPLENPLNPE